MGILLFHLRTGRFFIRIIQVRNIYSVNIFLFNGTPLSTRFQRLSNAQAYVCHMVGKKIEFNNLNQFNLFN